MTQYFRILGYLRPHAGLFAISIAMTLFAALDAFSFAMLIPFLHVLFYGDQGGSAGVHGGGQPARPAAGWAIGDRVASRPPDGCAAQRGADLFFIFLAKNVALYVQQYTVQMVQGRVTRDLRNQIYGHLLRLGFPFFQRTRTGQIITRVTMDVDLMRSLVTENLSRRSRRCCRRSSISPSC
jgi:ABC-type multidrug transport system fused ATPase/permease subunit